MRLGRLAALVLVLAAGCSGPSGSPARAAAHRHPPPRPASPVTAPVGQVSPAPPGTPTERGSRPINPAVDNGQQIVITPRGFEPALLIANDHQPVVWTNLSGQTQEVVFDQAGVRSGPIPPGYRFSFTAPTTASIHYHSTSGMTGAVDFNPNVP